MSQTYKATGIILKGMPLGENDRLVTILTEEYGLVRAVVPGARKYKSRLRGRSELFVVNELLIVRGRSLDKITQAETIESYPGLSQDLGKLSASQYLAELTLALALSEQPQTELYELLTEHLRRLERLPKSSDRTFSPELLAHLSQGVFHLLALAGIAPQVYHCCLTQNLLEVDLNDSQWEVGFSFEAGGVVNTSNFQPVEDKNQIAQLLPIYPPKINIKLNAIELTLLQELGKKSLLPDALILPEKFLNLLDTAWIKVERSLRDYTQYHIGRSLRSAALVDALSEDNFRPA
jgi:DNA repair protein RecO (recombination protein O)